MEQALTRTKAAALQLVAFDVDGVFTDGRFLLDEDGQEFKVFDTQDGYGIRRLAESGCKIAIITGRRSGAVSARMRELDVPDVIQGCRNKLSALEKLCAQYAIELNEVAYVGDDLPDLEAIKAAGLGIAVANAVDALLESADFTTTRSGGRGAVREICDFIVACKDEA